MPLFNWQQTMIRNSLLMIEPNTDPPFPIPSAGPPRLGLLDRFLAWLLKPIEFPGKWPDDVAPPERYNREVLTKPKLPQDP